MTPKKTQKTSINIIPNHPVPQSPIMPEPICHPPPPYCPAWAKERWGDKRKNSTKLTKITHGNFFDRMVYSFLICRHSVNSVSGSQERFILYCTWVVVCNQETDFGARIARRNPCRRRPSWPVHRLMFETCRKCSRKDKKVIV